MTFYDPHSYTDIDQGQVKHIDLSFDVDFDRRQLQVGASYTMDQEIEGSLYFDARDFEIRRIHAEGRELSWELDREDPILGQRLHIQGLNGINAFTIEGTTSPQASALQWLIPAQTSGNKYPYLYSQCQAIHARSIFPCQDTPTVRFTYRVEVTAPAPLVTLIAGSSLGHHKNGDKNVYLFQMAQPIPAYLFAIAVGDIQFRSIGDRCGVYAEPERIEAAALEFANTEIILDAAEKLFGPYVWDRYDLLILPPSFPYGGMENAQLTFLNPMYIVGDQSETIIVNHELAHAWTGNLITNASWEDFWLNEGWTTYAQYRITEAIESREYAQFRAALGRDYMFEDMKEVGFDSPQTQLCFPMKGLHPDEVISTIPYQKGNAFLVRLEEIVGREKFDGFIKEYISKFQFQSLTTGEFEVFLDQHLPEVFQSVDVKAWLYEPGFPEDAPIFQSSILDNINKKIEDFNAEQPISKTEVADWTPAEINFFLRTIPQTIKAERCRTLESLFDLATKQNASVLTFFYVIALQSGYREAFPRIEQFVQEIGRTFLLLRIYRAMISSEWSKMEVRRVFEAAKPRYHPITQATIEQVLHEANL